MRLTGAGGQEISHCHGLRFFFRKVSSINDTGKILFTALVCPPLLSAAFL